jgi:hypothetical protein
MCARASRNAVNWRAQAAREGRPAEEVEALIRRSIHAPLTVPLESPKSFEGEQQAFGWSAGIGNPPEAVQAALMAVEQYLYIRLDGKKDISTELTAILARGTSTAFLGLLCDIGKREIALFEGPLRPLLAVVALYSWDIRRGVKGRSHFMLGAYRHGEWFVNMAKAFHELPHRSRELRLIAGWLMIHRPAMREYFASVVAAWRKDSESSPDAPEADMRTQMIATLDPNPDNYEVREDPEHGQVLVNIEIERLQEANSEERQVYDDHLFVSGFPMRCRKLLDNKEVLSDADFEALWKDWNRVSRAVACRRGAAGGPRALRGRVRKRRRRRRGSPPVATGSTRRRSAA